jgi:hypothetical protein
MHLSEAEMFETFCASSEETENKALIENQIKDVTLENWWFDI